MTWISWDKENKLASDLKAGIEAAIDDSDGELDFEADRGIPGWNEANVKLQKFAHRVLNKQDIPILHTWFLYGQYQPHNQFKPEVINVQSLNSATDTPESPGVPRRDFPSPREIKGILTSTGLQEDLDKDLFLFLRENYRSAPQEYRKLYQANLNMLELLDNIYFEDDIVGSGEEYYQELKEISVDLRSELSKNPKFEIEVENHMQEGLRTMRNMFMMISQQQKPLNERQKILVEEGRHLYHRNLWRWPALVISKNEAEGVEYQKFRKKANEEIEEISDLQSGYPNKLEEYQKRLRVQNLLPSTNDYPRHKDSSPVRELKSSILKI